MASSATRLQRTLACKAKAEHSVIFHVDRVDIAHHNVDLSKRTDNSSESFPGAGIIQERYHGVDFYMDCVTGMLLCVFRLLLGYTVLIPA